MKEFINRPDNAVEELPEGLSGFRPELMEEARESLHSNAIEMTSVITERLPHFRRIAMRRLDNAAGAEDAVQDAFLAAWKHLSQFRGQASDVDLAHDDRDELVAHGHPKARPTAPSFHRWPG